MLTHNAFAAGYREIVFLSKEATYGTIVHPAATDAIQHQKASFQFAQERVNRADKTANRSTIERITHRKSATWSITLYNLPSGTSGTAPDVGDALEYCFGSVVINPDSAIATGASPTSLPLTIGDGSGFTIGTAVGWVNANNELEVSFITDIVTDTLTISPAFSGTPADSDVIKGSVNYMLANVLGSLSITRILDNFQSVYPGCFVNDLQVDFDGNGEGMITIGGSGQTEYSSGTSTVASAYTSGGTSITVATGEGKRFQPNTRVLIGSEVFLISAVSGDTLTVAGAQAGTTAANHAVNDVIGPYEPARTLVGSPISGTIGSFIITGSASSRDEVKIQQAGLTMNNQGSLRNAQFGTDKATGFYVNKRTVTFSATMWLEKSQAGLYNEAKSFTSQEAMIQLGKTVGSVCAVRLLKAEFDIPKVEAPDDSEVSVPFTGTAMGSMTSGNDECVMSYL